MTSLLLFVAYKYTMHFVLSYVATARAALVTYCCNICNIYIAG